MSQIETTQTAAVETTAAAPKGPSKKSRAVAIFAEHLQLRSQGRYPTNKEFRAAVLAEIQQTLEVSISSAATMYNTAKVEAEAADATVGLGRDPKKEKPVSTGKRGRPAGSKNKVKVVATADTTVAIDHPAEPTETAAQEQQEAAPAA